MQSSRILILVALLAVSGCGGSGGPPPGLAPATSPGAPPVNCERTCNSEYDSCMDRFPGVGTGPSIGQHSDEPASALGPNDVCPDQLKACLRRCT
jgi:hypothetical protein